MLRIKIALILAFLFVQGGFILGTISSSQAHSPSAMILSYNFISNTLNTTITHTTSDTETHYIYKIEIWKNDLLNTTLNYTNQPANTFTYSYQITGGIGDVLKVRASCNLSGSITKTLTVSTSQSNNVSLPLLGIGIISLTLIGLIGFSLKKKHY